MQTTMRKLQKLNSIVAIVFIVLFCLVSNSVFAATTTIVPNDSQYLELRAVSIDDVTGQNKQLKMELWSHDLDFKGFEVTFSYDRTKLKPSNISTNVIVDNDSDDYFSFESDFNGLLDPFILEGSDTNVIDMTITLNTPISGESTYIKSDGNGGYKVATAGKDVKIGTMSFQMITNDVFDISGFGLVTNTYTPQTGIKIDKSLTECYQAQSTFRFTDETASRNANLSNLIVSSGVVDELDPTNSTYKEYTLTPQFDKDEIRYEITLMEYKDTLDIKAILEDNTATMKIKVPKRDEDNKLVYEGPDIKYEESDLADNTKTEVTINKLGEPDTIITIIVTAEDTTTSKDYEIKIKRPYATIKGEVYTAPTVTSGKYISNIKLYNSADIEGVVNWSNLASQTEKTNLHSNMSSVESETFITEDDGKYEIYVIPKTYDIVLDKDGYLDHIYKQRTLNEGDVLDLGYCELFAGDLNKDGIINILDISLLNSQYLLDEFNPDYDTFIYYDFNEDKIINILDISTLNANYLKEVEVE